jgi:hypothetical protein
MIIILGYFTATCKNEKKTVNKVETMQLGHEKKVYFQSGFIF